ncbi:hypothetical protein [Bailinhaonella thermotolerans]|uniref:Uncharacterized protein n=1 Tax=Bailinhaonella thermotolerans TaxID=1070861 RepID=A0A3A4AA18_9ACTN|nr:hypothetical protein [Bailinhaonella thermotolerans]RJL23194.1 hypothetical protein D5H75_32975 [Bailinhaonella thermotolerans]
MEADRITRGARAADAADPIRSLTAIAELRRETARLETVAVGRGRTRGDVWTQIAAALVISEQATHEKYGGRGLFRTQE